MSKHRKSPESARKSGTGRARQDGGTQGLKAARKRSVFIVSLVCTLFGPVGWIGSLFLPDATLPDKVLLVIVCGALCVAGASGLVARPSALRSCIMTTAVSLAVLGLVAMSASQSTAPREPVSHAPVITLPLVPPRGHHPSQQLPPLIGRPAPEGSVHRCHGHKAHRAWDGGMPASAKARHWRWPDWPARNTGHHDSDADYGNAANP
jgi:hypothetical protein